jgi:Tfp pilus assembly protein PilO
MPVKEIRDIIFSALKTPPFKVMSRQKILLGIALLLGLGLLLYQSLLALQLTTSKAMGFYLRSQRRLTAYQEKIIQDPQILLSKIENKWNQLNRLEKRFIPEQRVQQLFDDLKDLIDRTENHLVSLDIRPPVSLGVYQGFPFVILVKGHYADVILLLNKFELYPYLIDIKEIKIQPTGGKLSEVTMSLEAEAFAIKD